jgi:hypothetical protein
MEGFGGENQRRCSHFATWYDAKSQQIPAIRNLPRSMDSVRSPSRAGSLAQKSAVRTPALKLGPNSAITKIYRSFAVAGRCFANKRGLFVAF